MHSQARDYLQQNDLNIMTFSNFDLFTSMTRLNADFYNGDINNYPDLFELLETF